ncbi:DUF397 domain-containing protein [Streptomyces sp. NPDC003691]
MAHASGDTSAAVAVRDSKNPTGPQLHLTSRAFAGLLDYARGASL